MTSASRTRATEIVRDVLHDEMCPTPSAVDADRCQGECVRVTRDVVMKLANAKLLLISQDVPGEGTRRAVGQLDDANGMCEIADALGVEPSAPAQRIVQGAVAAVELAATISTRDAAWNLIHAAARDRGLLVPEVDTTPDHVARAVLREVERARDVPELTGDPVMAGHELAAWRKVGEAAWQYLPDPTPKAGSPYELAERIVAVLATAPGVSDQLDTARAALGDIYAETLAPDDRTDDATRHGALLLPGSVVSRVRATVGDLRSECTRLTDGYRSLAELIGTPVAPGERLPLGGLALRVADLMQARAALRTIAQAAGMSEVAPVNDGRYATDVVTALWEHAPLSQASRIMLEVATLLHVPRDADASEVLPRVRELVAEVGTLRAANSALGDVAELVGLGRNDPPAAVLLAVQTAATGQPSARVNEVLHEVARTLGLGDHPVLAEIAERARNLRGEAHRNALCAGALDAVGRKLGLESDATLEAIVERTGKLVESLPSPGVVAELERLRDVVAVAQRDRDAALARRPDPAQQMAAAHLGALTALVMAAHEWDPTEGGALTRPDAFSREESGRFDERVRTTAWLLARAHAVIEEGGAHVG